MKGEKEAGKMELMEQIEDLIEEAKVRILWWTIAIFVVTYFMSQTSSSMWKNLPVAIALVSALRILTKRVEFRWKSALFCCPKTYLSHLERKQLSVNDSRLSCAPPTPKWKRKIDSPVVEVAINQFIDKVLKDFVVDSWYSVITPDMEAPELMRCVIMDAIGEISLRVKQINLVDLLTKDVLDLVGDHIDLFRRNQAAIGVDVMKTLSSEERDEMLKHHLMVSEDLHPALLSSESEYKVLQKLVSGILAIVLRAREAQCPIVRCFAREIVTCLILQPILDFANPGYINEMIEHVLLVVKEIASNQSGSGSRSALERFYSLNSQVTEKKPQEKIDHQREPDSECNDDGDERMVQPQPAVWARMLEAATQRRTEVLAPENLENMWTKGRNYKKKENNIVETGVQESISRSSFTKGIVTTERADAADFTTGTVLRVLSPSENITDGAYSVQEFNKSSSFEGSHLIIKLDNSFETATDGNKSRLKRSNSTSDLKSEPDKQIVLKENVISELYGPAVGRHIEVFKDKSGSSKVLQNEGKLAPRLRSRVIGAYFDKLGSKSFAVYSIAVTDVENRTWFVNRRYSNFERLHRHLKDIPNYALHLPPKRIFSSSTEDSFVQQRCIQLDKYLQDVLSIANVAEQHEVWDFLSASSKNYSFGGSSSVIRTLAVNVDDAVDDIVRQLKGVSDGLVRKVVGSSSPSGEASSSVAGRALSWNTDEINKDMEIANSTSDNEEGGLHGSHEFDDDKLDMEENASHSDDEPNLMKIKESGNLVVGKQSSDGSSELISQGEHSAAKFSATSHPLEDPAWIPPEWTPPKVSVPLLNLVDKVFQLKRRGWLRRQVFWLSKQIVQLVMEDAIDDFLLRQIYWLRKEDTIARGIRWVQDILWPGGIFFTNIGNIPTGPSDPQTKQANFDLVNQFGGDKSYQPGSFEQQLEAARRASDIKKLLFDGAPVALVGLVGQKQYRRCARDIFYFTQSSVCVKQLTYAMVELVVVSIFPEMRDLILDLHRKGNSRFKAG